MKLGLLAIPLLFGLLSCGNRNSITTNTNGESPPAVEFQDVTKIAGIEFTHTNGASGEKYLPETMGSGCAFFDFDNDGWIDIILVNSDNWLESNSNHPTLQLYRNDHHG